MAKYNYKTVSLRTVKGIKRAEWYKAHGWTIYASSPDTIKFYKRVSSKKAAPKKATPRNRGGKR